MSEGIHIAIDLGATSGRIMIGGGTGITEIYRFQTPVLRSGNEIYWDFELLFSHLITGLQQLPAPGMKILSLSCDSWAQDFGLLDKEGKLIAPPFSYRDKNSGINSTLRLEYIREKHPERYAAAETLLHIADLVHYRLCGAKRCNYSIAAISGPMGHPLLASLADCEIIGEINHPDLPGLAGIPVISGASHDTAAAFFGSGVQDGELLISLGTWLMTAEKVADGQEIPEGFKILPLVKRGVARWAGGMGLWPFQECVKLWQARGEFPGYKELDAAAESCGVPEFAIDPDSPELFSPADMEEAIFSLVGKKLSPPEITAALMYGLAEKIRLTVEKFQTDFRRAVIVGGGSRIGFLRRLLEEKLACPLMAGDSEAAAAGNIAVQREVIGSDSNI
jgi:rhamnulokinase